MCVWLAFRHPESSITSWVGWVVCVGGGGCQDDLDAHNDRDGCALQGVCACLRARSRVLLACVRACALSGVFLRFSVSHHLWEAPKHFWGFRATSRSIGTTRARPGLLFQAPKSLPSLFFLFFLSWPPSKVATFSFPHTHTTPVNFSDEKQGPCSRIPPRTSRVPLDTSR